MPQIKRLEADLLDTGLVHAYAVKAGPWIFLNGQEAYDFAGGVVAEVEGPPNYPAYGHSRYRREADFVVGRVRSILESYGAGLRDAVRVDQFYLHPTAVNAYHQTRRNEFGNYIPPSTSIIMDGCVAAGNNFSMNLIAVETASGQSVTPHYPPGVDIPQDSNFAPVAVYDDFVFVAGQMAGAFDLDPSVAFPPGRRWGASSIRMQTEEIITNRIIPALAGADTTLQSAVKAQVYLDDNADLPDFMEVWNKHFADIPCALTVIPATAMGLTEGIIEINLIAVKDNGRHKKSVVETTIPDMAAFGPCIRAGDFVFPSGMMAIDAEGNPACTADHAFSSLGYTAFAQASQILSHVATICSDAGGSLENVVRAQYFVPSIADMPAINRAWSKLAGGMSHPFAVMQVPDDLPAPDARMICDFWIYAPI